MPTEAQLLAHWGVPPAAGPAWTEAFASLQFAPYALRDRTGRPLGEANTAPALRRGLEVDERPCPYADDRAGAPMNTTALRLVREDWDAVGRATGALRAAWAARRGRAGPLPLDELWAFAATAQAMPLFLVRSRAVAPDAVPRPIASLFKVVQGVAMAAWAGLEAGDPDPDGVDALFAGVVARRLLHGRSGRVCAGPEGLVRELLGRCLHGDGSDPLPGADGLLAWGAAATALAADRTSLRGRLRPLADALLGAGPEEGPAWLRWAQGRAAAAAGRAAPDRDFDPAWAREARW